VADPPVRVLVVLAESAGGIGVHAVSLVDALVASGWPVAVAAPAGTAERFALERRGARVSVLPGRGGRRPAALLARARDGLRLRRLLADADVVHAHGLRAGVRSVVAARTLPARRRPVVVSSWHNAVLLGGRRGRLGAAMEAVAARGADLVTGASADLVERARAAGARRAELAPVAAPPVAQTEVDPAAARAALRSELGVDADTLVVLTVARIAPQKDLGRLVDAAAAWSPGAPAPGGPASAGAAPAGAAPAGAAPGPVADGPPARPVVLAVAGGGDEDLLAALRRRAAESEADVRFLGARRDVPALLAGADVFVLASTWEARALVVQEALAAGLPVVATAVGGLPELVEGAGVLVEPGSTPALAAAVRRLLEDEGERARLSAAARARARELPDEAEVAAGWLRRYAELAHRR
jgi:glycosyltransferase involved in cell wall biosynthesis